MSIGDYFGMTILIFGLWFITNQHIDIRHDSTITAIIDNGCASKFELDTSKVERIDNYNLNSLKNEPK